MDHGFMQAGAEVRYGAELDPWARETYAANHDFELTADDVANIRASRLRGVDVLLAGPPCQGFSSIGKRQPNDPRNRLLLHTARLIAEARPELFIVENVDGVRWVENGKYLQRCVDTIKGARLAVGCVVFDCADIGVPQRRRRVIVAGGAGESGRRLLSFLETLCASQRAARTVSDVLFPIPVFGSVPNHELRPVKTGWYDDVITRIGPGQKLCDTRLGTSSVHSWEIPEVFGMTNKFQRNVLEAVARLRRSEVDRGYAHLGDGKPVRITDLRKHLKANALELRSAIGALARKGYVRSSGTHVDLVRKFNGRFKRLRLDGQAPAVVREYAHPRNILHPTEPRALTVRECARLQTFDDGFEFHGPVQSQYLQVANAFPPEVSRHFADCVAAAMAGRLARA